jgi:hypothetical protein
MQIDELNCETAHLSKDFSKNGRSTPWNCIFENYNPGMDGGG